MSECALRCALPVQVCDTPEEYQDYDALLGVCVCAGRPERVGVCGAWGPQAQESGPQGGL